MNPTTLTIQSENHKQGELSLDLGGALSKEFKRKLNYNAFKVILVAGSNSASIQRGNDLVADKFVVGVESIQGKVVLQILNDVQPWGWESLKAVPFANALYFNGNINGKTWKYISAYPDTKLESLLVRLRKELQK